MCVLCAHTCTTVVMVSAVNDCGGHIVLRSQTSFSPPFIQPVSGYMRLVVSAFALVSAYLLCTNSVVVLPTGNCRLS